MDADRPLHRRRWTLLLALVVCALGLAASDTPDEENDTLAARRARLEEMPQSERDKLLRNQQRFEQLSEEQQQRLRLLHEELSLDPDAQQLREVMRRYQEWVKTLPSSQRAELPRLSAEERIERIKKWQAEERKQAGRRLALVDAQALLGWLDKRVLATLSEADRRHYQGIADPRERRAQMREHLEDPRSYSSLRQVTSEEIADLESRLSPAGQQVLAEAREAGRDHLRKLLYFWIAQARGGMGEARMFDVKHEDLTRYFDTLSDRDRDELLALPPDEMWGRLARRYMREKMGGSSSGRRPSGSPGNQRPSRRGDEDRAGPRGRPGPPPAPSSRDGRRSGGD